MGPGSLGPGPFLVGQTPHQKTHPGKKSPNCVFGCFLETKKMRDVRTIILAAVSRRDLCYVSENEGFLFSAKDIVLSLIWSLICSRNLLLRNGPGSDPPTPLPHAPGVRMR